MVKWTDYILKLHVSQVTYVGNMVPVNEKDCSTTTGEGTKSRAK